MRHSLSQYGHFDPEIKINQGFKVLSYFSLNWWFALYSKLENCILNDKNTF